MRYNVYTRVAVGAAALMLAAATVTAQDTTRTNPDSTARRTTTRSRARVTSSQRIPVRKDAAGMSSTTTTESGGSVAPTAARPNADSLAAAQRADSVANAERMRQDSIANAQRMRQDSIANAERMRQDSIAAAARARADSIARADSMARAARARMLGNGFYVQVGGGANFPTSDYKDFFNTGWNVTGSLGWHAPISPLGVRFDVAYDRFRGKGGTTINFPSGGTLNTRTSDASAWSFLGEGTLRIPGNLPVSPYLLGGGGVTRFSDWGGSSGSQTKGQWNVGGGIGFGFLNRRFFVESRYMHVATPGTPFKFVPLIVGFSI